MPGLFWMLFAVCVLGTLVPGYAIGAGIDLTRAFRDSSSRVWWIAEAAIRISAAAGLVASGFVAVSIAESQSDWVDVDGNGILDGFVAGQYDWTDLNGGNWAKSVLAATIVVVVAARIFSAVTRRRISDAAVPLGRWAIS